MHQKAVDISEDYRDFLFEVYGDREFEDRECERQQKLARAVLASARRELRERRERKEDTDDTY